MNKEKEAADISKLFSDSLHLGKDEEINILLLGAKGVGKSTFLNALANYLTYKTLEDAEKNEVISLVSTCFNITDKDSEDREVKIDVDDEETCDVPPEIESFVFLINKKKIKLRIIDTPGLGDQASSEQDGILCDNILTYIGQLRDLHAICCLFPVRETTINISFQNILKEFLKRFDKSITKNLIFIFTNAHANHYKPNVVMLKKFFGDSEIEALLGKIPLEYENIFCFENDSYRYLAAREQEIEFDNDTKMCYVETWSKSYTECCRLIEYIAGSSNSKPLKPYDLAGTPSVVQARALIFKFLQPLADVLDMIKNNVTVKGQYEQTLLENANAAESAGNSSIPGINLKVSRLSQPATICIGSRCAIFHSVGVVQNWVSTVRCCDPCCLKNSSTFLIDDPVLSDCVEMNDSGLCMQCGCDLSEHMHVYYTTKTELKSIATEDTANLGSPSAITDKIKDQLAEFQQEMGTIVKFAAQFVHFLQNNAMGCYDDPYEMYIQYLIKREESLEDKADKNNIDQMWAVLTLYNDMKTTFENQSKLQKKIGSGINLQAIVPKTILDSIEKLYTLRFTGSKIKEMIVAQEGARSKEFQETSKYIDLDLFTAATATPIELQNEASAEDWEMVEIGGGDNLKDDARSSCSNQKKYHYRPRFRYTRNEGNQSNRGHQGNRGNDGGQGRQNQGNRGNRGNRRGRGGNRGGFNRGLQQDNPQFQNFCENQMSNREAPPPYTPFPEQTKQSNPSYQHRTRSQPKHFNRGRNVPHVEVNIFQSPAETGQISVPSLSSNKPGQINVHTSQQSNPQHVRNNPSGSQPQNRSNRGGAVAKNQGQQQNPQHRRNNPSGSRPQNKSNRGGANSQQRGNNNSSRPVHSSTSYRYRPNNRSGSDKKDCIIS